MYDVADVQRFCHAMTVTYPVAVMAAERYIYSPELLDNDVENLIDPFSKATWAMILFSLVSVTTVLLVILVVYQKLDEGLVNEGANKVDVIFKCLGTLTEPERLSFFPRLNSGGKLCYCEIYLGTTRVF